MLVRGVRQRAPKGAAQALPYIARVPGGIAAALLPFRFDRLRRLPITYGPLSKRPVPARGDGPLVRTGAAQQRRSAAICASTCCSAAQGRRDLLAAADALRAFDRPALVAWASEDRLMPREHGPRLAELLPQGTLVEIADSYTLIPEDQPAVLAAHLRELLAR